MRILSPFLIALTALTAAGSAQASAGPRERDQESAFRGTQAGRIIPLRAIEQRIVPQMRGFAYLGPEYYADVGRYRLKFLRGQRVVWIDVDARTGEVIGKSGM
ncbi:MAG TPA: PepSY domain-containing protein [Allosphingosinicella sp.]|nr:PepSY domain-containing protein [Allosphingosinicella sp.]